MEERFIPYEPLDKLNARSVLVLAAHPDDEVFGCGGAIKKHALAGIPVKVIIVTDGGQGVTDLDDTASISHIRKEESLQASKVLGYGHPTFWGLPDRGVEFEESLVNRILQTLQATNADLVYAPSPYEIHPDHRNLARAALEAVRRLDRDVLLAMYEVGAPFRPNALLDISDVWSYKEKAMGLFKSQNTRQPYHQQIAGLNRYRTYTLPPNVTHAEAYFIVHGHELKRGWGDIPTKLSFEHPLRDKRKTHPLVAKGNNRYGQKVSILIRSIGRSTLYDAIKSVEGQTYPNIEIVVVNAKGPGHPDITSVNSRFELRFIDSSTTLSRGRAGNIALKNARGELLMFLDDDDYLLPDHVHLLAEALSNAPEMLVAYSRVQCVGPHGEPLQKIIGNEFDPVLLLAGNYIPIHAAVFSRTLVEAGLRMDESFDLYEDWDLWLQAAQYSDFIFVPKVTACYRVGEGSGEGFSPDTKRRRKAAQAIFMKWSPLWSKAKLDYIIQRLGEANIDPNILEGARALFEKNTPSPCTNGHGEPRIAVIVHIYYEELWPEIKTFLKRIPYKFHLYATLSGPHSTQLQHEIQGQIPDAKVYRVENKGRDVLPFLRILPQLIEAGYDCALKIHTKKSTHIKAGAKWREQLLNSLVGTEEMVREIVSRFKEDHTIGILGPHTHFVSCSQFIDSNHQRVLDLAERICPGSSKEDWCFFAGSMFWFRPAALLPLLSLGLRSEDFEKEKGQREGTLAHALERIFPIAVRASGYSVESIEESYEPRCNNNAHLYSYPFAPRSALFLLEDRDRLKERVQLAEQAKAEAERLAIERLNEIKSLQEEVARLEALAIERLSEAKELQSALKKAEDLAFKRLSYIKELETGLKKAQDLALERLERLGELDNKMMEQERIIGALQDRINEYEALVSALYARLEHIENHWLWRNAKKAKKIWDKILGRKKPL